MYNFQTSGETKKESLSDDDIQAICDIYPTSKDPGACEPVARTSGRVRLQQRIGRPGATGRRPVPGRGGDAVDAAPKTRARSRSRGYSPGMSAVCPACGVAVVPGYVRCPRCHAGLPHVVGAHQAHHGGSGRHGGRAARVPVLGGARRGRRRGRDHPGVRPAARRQDGGARGGRAARAGRGDRRGVLAAGRDGAGWPCRLPSRRASTPRPRTAARPRPSCEVDPAADSGCGAEPRSLGPRIDVRSGSCADQAMPPAIDGERAVLRGAGLTKLRCLEQSGAVVFERDL